MKKTVLLFWLILLFLSLYIVNISLNNKSIKRSKCFWNEIGVDRQKIENIYFEYKGQRVNLNEQQKKEFCEALDDADNITVEDNHEFKVSDINAIFVVNEKEYVVQFCWFYHYDTQNLGKKIGEPRFDAIINGKKFHFSFSNTTIWNEDRINSIYDRNAKSMGLLSKAELDGGDGRWEEGFVRYVTFQPVQSVSKESIDLKEKLEKFDVIILTRYICFVQEAAIGDNNALDGKYIYWGQYKVEECLKGEWDDKWYLEKWSLDAPAFRYYNKIKDRVYIDYDNEYLNYKVGETYLLCLNQKKDKEFYIAESAILDGDTFFPIYNTEQSVFYNINLQTVEDLLN